MTALGKPLFVLLACLTTAFAAASELSLQTSASLEDSETSLAVEFSITNKMTVPIRLYRSNLPWMNASSTLILVVKPDHFGTRVEREYLLDNPGLNKIEIQPNETMSGKVDLYQFFPSLAAKRKQGEFLLFWTSQTKDVERNKSPRTGGMLVIPRRTDSR